MGGARRKKDTDRGRGNNVLIGKQSLKSGNPLQQ